MNGPKETGGAQASPAEGNEGNLTMTSNAKPSSARAAIRWARRRSWPGGATPLILALALAASPAFAEAPATPAPSEIMVVNLIRLLVKQGVITQSAADALIDQAQAEAKAAKAAAAETPPPAAAMAQLPPPPADVIRIPYVPQVVRDQIKEDVRKDVMAQAKAEGWASPGTFPDWVSRVHVFGDMRFRDEFDLYSSHNDDQYIDYATFNANGPTDINANTNPNNTVPYLNTRTNRIDQLSLRARFGLTADIFNGVSTTVRLATGSDNSPVSTTQLLGGGLTKKDIWLDQAYITLTPLYWTQIHFGRVPDLFMHTSLLFDDNLNFDGVLGTARHAIGDQGLKLFGAAGVFPLDYVPNTFPANSGDKESDSSKWLYAVQAGAEFQPDALSWSVSGAVSFYDFQNVQGHLSDPCDIYAGVKQCDTDSSRPSFMQKGNTLFLIRDIVPDPSNPNNYAQPQYVGLSYDYRLVDAMVNLESPLFGPTRVQLQGDYVRNLAYDPNRILNNPLLTPVTNRYSADGVNYVYKSGPNAWQAKLTVGYLHPETKGDWNIAAGYKYIEPDAVLDAFNDHDFHLGGTNAKGYFLYGTYYFANNAWLDARWFSATEVFPATQTLVAPLAIDVLQLELNTKF
jgi:hypothetical protein